MLWIAPHQHNAKFNIQTFEVGISDEEPDPKTGVPSSFKTIYNASVDKAGSPHFHLLGPQSARFIKVTFLDNFGDPNMIVDNVWIVQSSPPDVVPE